MLPFERDMYLTLFEVQLEEENKKIGQANERGYV